MMKRLGIIGLVNKNIDIKSSSSDTFLKTNISGTCWV
jgi:hypothetical protein